MPEAELHRELMRGAIERDREAHEALLAGDAPAARAAFLAASDFYRESWEAAPPRSYGRLVGMLKSAVLGGEGAREGAYTSAAIPAAEAGESATASYALAIAALLEGDDALAQQCAQTMRGGDSQTFARAAGAVDAIARLDRAAFAAAVAGIVRDFEQRPDHLTGVPIADTALMLEVLGHERGLTSGVQSPLLPIIAWERD